MEICPINLSQVKRKKVSQLDSERYIASVIPALDYSDFKKVCLIKFRDKQSFLKPPI